MFKSRAEYDRVVADIERAKYDPKLSPKAEASLKAGLESAKTGQFVYLGSFAQFAEDASETEAVSAKDMILAVLAAAEGERFGATHLHKALFLVARDRLKFVPGDYGPYSGEALKLVAELVNERLVFSVTQTTFAGTYKGVVKGLEVLERLPNEAQIREWVSWCLKQSFTEIVNSFLKQYPSMFAKSSTGV